MGEVGVLALRGVVGGALVVVFALIGTVDSHSRAAVHRTCIAPGGQDHQRSRIWASGLLQLGVCVLEHV